MMIEAKHQNKGLGKLALKQLIEIIKSISVNESFIWISTEEKMSKQSMYMKWMALKRQMIIVVKKLY